MRIFHLLPIVLLLLSGAANAAITLYYTEENGSHCYDIVVDGDRPVKSVTLGSTWDGHPVPATVSMEVVSIPEGWTHEIIVKERYDFQYVELTASSHEAKPGHSVGEICLSLSEDVPGLHDMPFAYEQEGSSRRLKSNAIVE